MNAETTLGAFIRQSPDAIDTAQRLRGKDTVVIDWKPKGDVVPYAFVRSPVQLVSTRLAFAAGAVRRVPVRKANGHFVLEMVTPQDFEAAVSFPRPGWLHMRSQRTLIKYALKKLETGAEPPDHRRRRSAGRVENRRSEGGHLATSASSSIATAWRCGRKSSRRARCSTRSIS